MTYNLAINRIARWAFLGMGCVLVSVSVWWMVRMISFVHTAASAEGKVIALETSRRRPNRPSQTQPRMTRPVVEFRDAQGNSHRMTAAVGSSPPLFKHGERVVVLYDPADPQRAHIRGFVTLWLGPCIAGLLGGGFLYAARQMGKRKR